MTTVVILTSKWFDHSEKNILHIPYPSMDAVYALIENNSLEEVILTDCKKELYAEDIQEIIAKKNVKTNIQGVYYIHKSTKYYGQGNSWEEIIENSMLDEKKT
jgi:hypothetical protein